jgi:hypothetical protein
MAPAPARRESLSRGAAHPVIATLRACACACFLAGVAIARAAPSFHLEQAFYAGLNPGGTFAVNLVLDNPDPITLVAYDFFMHTGSVGIFFLDAQSPASPVSNPSFAGVFPFSVAGTDDDFGAFNSTFTQGFAQGQSVVQTLTFRIAPLAQAGTYTLMFGWNQPSLVGGPSLLDGNATEYQMASPLVLTVNVVPEPRAAALLVAALGVAGCIGRRRRRKAFRAH